MAQDIPADLAPEAPASAPAAEGWLRTAWAMLWPSGWALLMLYGVCSGVGVLFELHVGDGLKHALGWGFGAVTTLALWWIYSAGLQRWRWLRLGAWVLHMTALVILMINLLTTGRSADLTFLMENFKELFSEGGVAVLGGHLENISDLITTQLGVFCYLITLLPVLAGEAIWRSTSRRRLPSRASAVVAGAAAVLISVMASSVPLYDELALLGRSAIHATLDMSAIDHEPGTYPLIRTRKPEPSRWLAPDAPRPDVFVVMVESFNAEFVEAKTPSGEPVMPFLKEKLKEGVYFERAYSTSTKTIKGQFSTFTGVLPSLRSHALEAYPRHNYFTIFHAARQAGYTPVFMHAYEHFSFQGSWAICHNGPVVCEAGRALFTEADDAERWNWGHTDALFYARALDRLAQVKAEHGGKPLLVVLATINNHAPFHVPPSHRRLFKDPKNIREHYSNSVRLSDEGLAALFGRLEALNSPFTDPLVMVLGDHSTPIRTGEVAHQHMGYDDDLYHIPLLLWWPGHLKPYRDDRPASQVDVPPTLWELLGWPVARHHALGSSLLERDRPRERRVFMIQPYDGIYITSLRWPYKYAKNLRTDYDTRLHDLSKDPEERHPLPLSTLTPAQLAAFEADIQFAKLSYHLIQTNAVWDTPNPEAARAVAPARAPHGGRPRPRGKPPAPHPSEQDAARGSKE